jgi:hypothetical protein
MRIIDYVVVRKYRIVLNPDETARIREAGLCSWATFRYGNRPGIPMAELCLTKNEIDELRAYLDCDADYFEKQFAEARENIGGRPPDPYSQVWEKT